MIEVKNLTVELRERKKVVSIIDNISFQVKDNRCLGILGESGSGKSITSKAIMGLLESNFIVKGNVYFKGNDILKISNKSSSELRGKYISMILQNPMTSFNPLFTVGNQMVETFREHLPIKKDEALKIAVESLEKMNLNNLAEILKKYPHELSGGMLQRIMIAITIALKPDLIIADEPTTAIDSINQIEVVEEFKRMKKFLKTSMIFITHDLGVLTEIADDGIVMNKGKVIESGTISKIINNPEQEHTKYLIDTRLKLFKKFYESLI